MAKTTVIKKPAAPSMKATMIAVFNRRLREATTCAEMVAQWDLLNEMLATWTIKFGKYHAREIRSAVMLANRDRLLGAFMLLNR